MEFRATSISGLIEIHPTRSGDDRGYFVRTYCAESWAKAGLEFVTAQMALSYNRRRGTLRGLHVIPENVGEAKLVRCVRGRVFDVAVDVRAGSATFGQWIGCELSADNLIALHLPRGIAHGFLTLEEDTEIAYQFSRPYRSGIEKGIRWDDPEIGIAWPEAPVVLSDRDHNLPTLTESGLA